MKYLVFILALVTGGCSCYQKGETTTYTVPIQGYSQIDSGYYTFSRLKKIPRKVLRKNDFSRRKITADSLVFLLNRNYYLFVQGGFDKKSRRGFALLQSHAEIDSAYTTTCLLFDNHKKQVNICSYSISGRFYNWKNIRPYLDEDHHRIFGGWLMTERESRRCARVHRIKHFFNLKS